jgi:hypothetical protein
MLWQHHLQIPNSLCLELCLELLCCCMHLLLCQRSSTQLPGYRLTHVRLI